MIGPVLFEIWIAASFLWVFAWLFWLYPPKAENRLYIAFGGVLAPMVLSAAFVLGLLAK